MNFQIKYNNLDDGSFQILVTVPLEEIKKLKEKISHQMSKNVNVKGFRKGKAPKQVAEKQINQDQLYQIMVQQIVQESYQEAIKQNQIKPAIPPQVSLKSAQKDHPWQIEIKGCQVPEIDVSQAIEEIKKTNAKEKIWTPEKGDKGKEKQEEMKQEQLEKILAVIVEKSKITLPKILVEYEINRRLTDLIDQTQKVGLTIEQYLQSKGVSLPQLKKQYQQQIENNWKLETALEKLADQYQVSVEEKDLEKYKKNKIEPYIAAKIARREKTLEQLMVL